VVNQNNAKTIDYQYIKIRYTSQYCFYAKKLRVEVNVNCNKTFAKDNATHK